MGEVRLSGLAHMHVQYSQPIDVEAVINHFATTCRPCEALKLYCLIVAVVFHYHSSTKACVCIVSLHQLIKLIIIVLIDVDQYFIKSCV